MNYEEEFSDTKNTVNERQVYYDVYGHKYNVDLENIMVGEHGAVLLTDDGNLALKIAIDPKTRGFLPPDDNNKYMDLRILPIPKGLNITLPQATLKDVKGYVMTLLSDMTSLEAAFTLNEDMYERDKQNNILPISSTKILELSKSDRQSKLLYAYMVTGGMRRRLMAYMKTAAILARLHAAGLIYGDFSAKNVFISSDLAFDNVWLIDADNIDFAETIKNGYFTVGVAAPELIAGEGVSSTYSDAFSFASSFFNQMFHHHPFEGKAFYEATNTVDFIEDVDNARYEGRFPWMLDDDDNSNDGRDYLLLPPEFMLTDGLFKLFKLTFSYNGVTFPKSRPTLFNWAYEIAWAYDNAVFSKQFGLHYIAEKDNWHICPYTDGEIYSIRLESYAIFENGSKKFLWQYTHELTEEIVRAPIRLLNGFRAQEIDESAFFMETRPDGIMIKGNLEGVLAFTVKDEPTMADFQKAGSFLFKKNQKHFFILAERLNSQNVLIEGTVHD